MNIGVRAVHKMLLSVCGFHENRRSESCTFIVSANGENTLKEYAVKPYDILKVKNAFGKYVYCVVECSTCSVVMYYV
jgi:hypothetical protein